MILYVLAIRLSNVIARVTFIQDFSYCPWLALTVWKGKRPSDDAISLREEQWKHADMEKELIESSGDEKVRYSEAYQDIGGNQ